MAIVCRKTFIAPSILAALLCLWAHDFWSMDFSPELVRGKRVIVTGASRGIGRHVALHYASLGAKLLLVSRDETHLAAVKRECAKTAKKGRPAEVYYLVADQGSPEAAERVVAEAVAIFGGVDTLFLNHAISTLGFWEGSSSNVSSATEAVDVNYLSYIRLFAAARPHLEKVKGNVVVVSTAAARWPLPTVAHYGASKLAVDGFFRSLDLEFRLRGIHVGVTVCVLGAVKTERFTKNLLAFNPRAADSLGFRLAAHPSETADFMIKAAALRKREVRYPFTQMILGDLVGWMPEPVRLAILKRSVPGIYGMGL